MLAGALAAEVDAYVAAFAAERGGDGRRLVVRNGYYPHPLSPSVSR
jgi:putative transposase